MKNILHIFLAISLNKIKDVTCIEYLEEQAWMDNRGRDTFFDYAELAEANRYFYNTNGVDLKNYNNNVDAELFLTENVATQKIIPSTNTNIVSLFLNSIKKVIQPQRTETHQNVKETSKGLDIKLDRKMNFLPNFGNNQDTKFTVIGTKWCGAGDSAKDKNDVGYFYLTDNCCRDHDLCPMSLAAQETKYGLRNSGKFTRSHCDCDQKFYQCLKDVNTMLSNQVGKIYYNVLGHQCFKEDFPVTKCKSSIKSRCIHYETDTSKPKTFQWLDNPWF